MSGTPGLVSFSKSWASEIWRPSGRSRSTNLSTSAFTRRERPYFFTCRSAASSGARLLDVRIQPVGLERPGADDGLEDVVLVVAANSDPAHELRPLVRDPGQRGE